MREEYCYTYPENTTASLIYLRPEQIRITNHPQKEGQDRNAIIRLSESIKRYGILQPLSVRLIGDLSGFPAYELVSGERRLRAARLLGLEKVPCTVLSRDDKSCATAAIFEDLRSKRLHIFEQAAAFRLLCDKYHLTQDEIARKVGVSQSSIANKLRLLRFSQEEQAKILAAGLSERHARALLRLTDPQKRALALEEIVTLHHNVAATERLVETILSAPQTSGGKEEQGETSRATPLQNSEEGRNWEEQGRENTAESPRRQDLGGENEAKTPEKPIVTLILSPEEPPGGICPRKFVLQDLTPLYNSIERTLTIFRKTGQKVECWREESTEGIKIIIDIPHSKHA